MTHLSHHTMHNEADTKRFAQVLAAVGQPGDLIALSGDLGAGKSTFARAFIRAATGVPDLEVPSPTFTLVQAYDHPTGYALYHADLYRLESEEDVEDIGLDDERADALLLVEWPDRLPKDWRANALELTFTYEDQDKGSRLVMLATKSDNWADRLTTLNIGNEPAS